MTVISLSRHEKFAVQTATSIWLPSRYIGKTEQLNIIKWGGFNWYHFDPAKFGLSAIDRLDSDEHGELLQVHVPDQWFFKREFLTGEAGLVATNDKEASRMTFSFYRKPPNYFEAPYNDYPDDTPLNVDLSALIDREGAERALRSAVMLVNSGRRFDFYATIRYDKEPPRGFPTREGALESLKFFRHMPATLEFRLIDHAQGPFWPEDPLLYHSHEIPGEIVIEPLAWECAQDIRRDWAMTKELTQPRGYADLPAHRLIGEMHAALRAMPLKYFIEDRLPSIESHSRYWDVPRGEATERLLKPLVSIMNDILYDRLEQHLAIDGFGHFRRTRHSVSGSSGRLYVIAGGKSLANG